MIIPAEHKEPCCWCEWIAYCAPEDGDKCALRSQLEAVTRERDTLREQLREAQADGQGWKKQWAEAHDRALEANKQLRESDSRANDLAHSLQAEIALRIKAEQSLEESKRKALDSYEVNQVNMRLKAQLAAANEREKRLRKALGHGMRHMIMDAGLPRWYWVIPEVVYLSTQSEGVRG